MVRFVVRASLSASAAGTAALCSSRVPSRPRRAGGGNSPKGRAQDARASDLGTRMCRERTPEPAREVCRAWMPGKPRPRGCPFLWLLSFGQAKESNRQPWMADEKHTDVSRLSQQRTNPNSVIVPQPRRPMRMPMRNLLNRRTAHINDLDIKRQRLPRQRMIEIDIHHTRSDLLHRDLPLPAAAHAEHGQHDRL